jgi:hypothetical protein
MVATMVLKTPNIHERDNLAKALDIAFTRDILGMTSLLAYISDFSALAKVTMPKLTLSNVQIVSTPP